MHSGYRPVGVLRRDQHRHLDLAGGNHLDVVVDVGGIPIVTERSLEKDPVEIGEKVYVLIYRLYIFDENQTYLVENREMQEGEVFYI